MHQKHFQLCLTIRLRQRSAQQFHYICLLTVCLVNPGILYIVCCEAVATAWLLVVVVLVTCYIQTGVRANVDLQGAVAREALLTVATSVFIVRIFASSASRWRHAATDAGTNAVQFRCEENSTHWHQTERDNFIKNKGQSNLAKGDIAGPIILYAKEILSISSVIFAMVADASRIWSLGCILYPHWERKGRRDRKIDGGFLKALHYDHCAISNHQVVILHQMSPTLKSTGGESVWGKIWRERSWPM